jgi:uncharacterized protein YlxP (DUF503 family)
MSIGLLVMTLRIPGCSSLKEKRGRLKPLLTRLHRDYNLSVAEVDDLDIWQSAVVACTVVSNDPNQTRRVLQKTVNWVESSWRDLELVDEQIELL